MPPVAASADRPIAVHLIIALCVWLGVVAVLSVAAIVRSNTPRARILELARSSVAGPSGDTTRYAQTTGLARFAAFSWKVLLPVLGVDLLMYFVPFGPSFKLQVARIVAFVFCAVVLFIGALSAHALITRGDPWAYLPGGPPFHLREFARKHPQFRIETRGFGGDIVNVFNGPVEAVFGESELRGADLTWEKCDDPSEPVRLGGPPPYAGSECLARIHIRRTDYDDARTTDDDPDSDEDKPVPRVELRTTKYVYRSQWKFGDRESDVRRFYNDWARKAGLEFKYYTEIETGGRTWHIDYPGRKEVVYIYLSYTDKKPL